VVWYNMPMKDSNLVACDLCKRYTPLSHLADNQIAQLLGLNICKPCMDIS
jgi:hypothetical protein